MISLSTSLARAFGQLGDPAIIRVVVKSVVISLAIFAVGGGALLYGLYHGLVSLGLAFSGEISVIAAIILTVVAGWLLFRIVALAVLQFFADEIVAAVEARHYPEHAASVRKVPRREEIAQALRSAARAVAINALALPFALALLATGMGTALLFWAVNGWLLGRELMEMIWLRHRHDPQMQAPLDAVQRFQLGGVIAAMMLVPFLNLIAPVIGAASATHLVHARRAAR